MLFREKEFNFALLISASWHFFLMLMVVPVFIPGDIKSNRTTISFLGAILEKVITVPEKRIDLDSISFIDKVEDKKRRDLKFRKDFQLKEAGDANKIDTETEKMVISAEKYEGVRVPVKPENVKKRDRITFKEVSLAGAVKDRLLLYKPDLPKPFVPSVSFNSAYRVSVRFSVARDGFVRSPEPVISSGSFEADQAAIRYVRKWQFVPTFEQNEDFEEGIISVNFENL